MKMELVNKRLALLSVVLVLMLALGALAPAYATNWQKGYYNPLDWYGKTSIKVTIWQYDVCTSCSARLAFVAGWYNSGGYWTTMELVQDNTHLFAQWEPELAYSGTRDIPGCGSLVWGRNYEFNFWYENSPSYHAHITVKDLTTGSFCGSDQFSTHGNSIGFSLNSRVYFMAESGDYTKADFASGLWGKMKVYTTTLYDWNQSGPVWVLVSKAGYGTYSWISWTRQA